MIPCLMITYNRLEYTKQSLPALIDSGAEVYVIDNGSIDGTAQWLVKEYGEKINIELNPVNKGIAGAMNQFLQMIPKAKCAAKVDNDTIIPKDFFKMMLAHMKYAEIVQAKHHIIKSTNPNGWKGFTKDMYRNNGLLYHHFVGGSGVVFKRQLVDYIPETEWKLGGWRQFQRRHPEIIKAFAEDVEIKLLDEHGYSDYPNYYKETGRLC